MFYKIKEVLTACKKIDDIFNDKCQYVAVLNSADYEKYKDKFDMGIELDLAYDQFAPTKVEVNYDALIGHFRIPSRENNDTPPKVFSFALDEKGIVFIDDNDVVSQYIDKIKSSKKWRFPTLERFLYDFLEAIVIDDLRYLESYDCELDNMEDRILEGKKENVMSRLVDIRSILLDLRPHYEQLIDMAIEFEENENDFFLEENLRFFHLFKERASRLQVILTSVREHSLQVKDLYQAQIDVEQNRTMSVMTVILSIFTPLTLITGWYGMNFVYMPELNYKWAYPAVFGVCIVIIICLVVFFKKKKLL